KRAQAQNRSLIQSLGFNLYGMSNAIEIDERYDASRHFERSLPFSDVFANRTLCHLWDARMPTCMHGEIRTSAAILRRAIDKNSRPPKNYGQNYPQTEFPKGLGSAQEESSQQLPKSLRCFDGPRDGCKRVSE